MSKILKKSLAAFMIVLMLFVSSFNVISYAATISYSGDNLTATITSGKFKLIVPTEFVADKAGGEYFTAHEWASLLARYDGYYSTLNSVTNYDPISVKAPDYITIDLTEEELPSSNSDNAAANVNRNTLTIKVEKRYTSIICKTNSSTEFGPLVHELGHLFTSRDDRADYFWDDSQEITNLLLQSIICEGKQVLNTNGRSFGNIEYFQYRSQYGLSDNYNIYNEIAYKILSNTSVSAVRQAISENTGHTSSTNLERFEKFITSLNRISGKDISAIKLSNGQTLYQYAGGETESINDINVDIQKISVEGDKSKEEGTLDFIQEDEKATVTVEVKSNKQPKSVKVKLGDKEVTITDPSSKNNDVYTYTTEIDISSETTMEALEKDKKIYVTITDANGNTKKDYKTLTVELEEKVDPYIDARGTYFQQEGNNEKSQFDAKLDSKKATLNIKIENVGDIDDAILENLKFVVKNCDGFKQVSKTPTDIKIRDTYAIYTIELEYTELSVDDLIEEKYIECIVETTLNKKKINNSDSPLQVEVLNVEEETEERAYYYQVGIEEATEFKKGDTIELKSNADISFKIAIKNEDTSDKPVIFGENQTINGRYNKKENHTIYSMRFAKSGTYIAKFEDGELLTINVTIENSADVQFLYVFNDSGSGSNNVSSSKLVSKAYTDRPKANTVDIPGVSEENWIIRDENNVVYYCLDSDKGLEFGSGTFYYEYRLDKEFTIDNLSKEQQLILAFLKNVSDEEVLKISELSSLPKNWRENIIQYYIWNSTIYKEQPTSYGIMDAFIKKLVENENGKNDYINVEKETITLDGKEYKIKENSFKVAKYIVLAKLYSETGDPLWLTKTDSETDLQPLFTFEVEIEETDIPSIQLKKVDTDGKPLVATFRVCHKGEDGKWKYSSSEDEYTTDEKTGLTDKIPMNKQGEYFIYEIKAPEGCKPTTQYIRITVYEDGTFEYKVYQAKNLTDDGYVKTAAEDDKEITDELDWEEIIDGLEDTEELSGNDGLEQTEELGEIQQIVLKVTNKYKNPPPLKIIKVDQNGNPIGGKGGEFEVTINGKTFKNIGINNNGEIVLPKEALDEILKAKELTIKITEKTPPDGYSMPKNNTNEFKVELTDDGWKIIESNNTDEFKVSLEDNIIKVEITNKLNAKKVKLNVKKIDGNTGEPLSGVGFSIEGIINDSDTTNAQGEINFDSVDLLVGRNILTITETNPPANYNTEIITPIIIEIIVNEDGSINTPEIISVNSFAELSFDTTKEDIIEITVTIKNFTQIIETPMIEVPMLMYIEGDVWLDGITGKESDSNNILGDKIDKNLEGILVQLYEEDGESPASVAIAKDLQSALDQIEAYQNQDQGFSNDILERYKEVLEQLEKDKSPDGKGNYDLVGKAKSKFDNIRKVLKNFYGVNGLKDRIDDYNAAYSNLAQFIEDNENFGDNGSNHKKWELEERCSEAYSELTYILRGTGVSISSDGIIDEDEIRDIRIQLLENQMRALEDYIYTKCPILKALQGTDIDITNLYLQEIVNEETMGLLREHLGKLQELQDKGIFNTTVTDENGHFKFYGLNPNKKYTVKFTYNGMRYEDVIANYTIGSTTSDSIIEKNSKAIEDENKREELTKRFSEIGPYPKNYITKEAKYNTVFSQEQVNNALKEGKQNAGDLITLYFGDNKEIYGNLSSYIDDSNYSQDGSIVQFIKDTLISANTEGIGGIMEEARNTVKDTNGKIDPKTKDIVYPVVKKVSKGSFGSKEEADKEYLRLLNEDNSKIVGYEIDEIAGIQEDITKIKGHPHPSTRETNTFTGIKTKYISYKEEDKIIGYELRCVCNLGSCSYVDPASVIMGNKPQQCGAPYGIIIERYWQDVERYDLYCFEIVDAYSEEEKNNIWFGKFDKGEPYFTKDEEFPGYYDSELTGFNKNGITVPTDCVITNYGWGKSPERTAAVICYDLVFNLQEINRDNIEGVEKKGLTHMNFGVKYRPTMDLGLYNDVIEAYVNVNNKDVTYHYDKRETNGGAFRFGVNEYDLRSAANYEEAYADYYKNLSNGNSINNFSEQTDLEHIDLRQKEDIFPNESTEPNAAINYKDDYPIDIVLTYKIRVVNQAGVESEVTEVVDFYDKNFDLIEVVYADQTPITTSDTSMYFDRGASAKAPSGYNVKYIQLNKSLKNNEYIDIYIKVKMTNPRVTLKGMLEPGGEGYKTLNYAEINGYKTKIGVLDVDSIPGNLTTDAKRGFEPNPFEDDESKSPTFIIRNPGDKVRIIKGVLFEDVTASELKTGENRDGDGLLDGSDTRIKDGIVQLIEVDDNGNPIDSDYDKEPGLRCELPTNENGEYEFTKIVAGNYMVRFKYGSDDKTVLVDINGGSNAKSYNGQDYENTKQIQNIYDNKYWYTQNTSQRTSDALDDDGMPIKRRPSVIAYSTTLTNHKAEVFNSYKDSSPNRALVDELIRETWMHAQTKLMSLEVESYQNYQNQEVNVHDKSTFEKGYEYVIDGVDFGIVERERAELQITKKVSEISIVDSTGKKITGGKAGEQIDYVKWIQDENGGFVDMEIDKEVLKGSTLTITYEISVANNSEAGNIMNNVKVIDYVSNNSNYSEEYHSNSDATTNVGYGWKPITVQNAIGYLNKTSIETDNKANKIDLLTYQTLLMADFENISPGSQVTKYLTVEKNLSSQSESGFNFENQVEIVESVNPTGRGDYSSIYGNLDPLTYTSRQGDLNWDVTGEKPNRFNQEPTTGTDDINPTASIRLAEKDSGNAEEVIITPPTGTKAIVLQPIHYVLVLISLTTLAGAIVLIKKYIAIPKE